MVIETKPMKHLKLPDVSNLKDCSLKRMMRIQRRINSAHYDPEFMSEDIIQSFLKEYCLAKTAEFIELLDQINWKIMKGGVKA